MKRKCDTDPGHSLVIKSTDEAKVRRALARNKKSDEAYLIVQTTVAGAHRPMSTVRFMGIIATAIIVGLICKHILHLTDIIVFIVAILLPVGYIAISQVLTIIGMRRIALYQLPQQLNESDQHYQQRIAVGKRLAPLPLIAAVIVGIVSFGILFLFTYVVWISQ